MPSIEGRAHQHLMNWGASGGPGPEGEAKIRMLVAFAKSEAALATHPSGEVRTRQPSNPMERAQFHLAELHIALTEALGEPRPSGMVRRALEIIETEKQLARNDEPGNIVLYALRLARIDTAEQILGARALAAPAPPAAQQQKG